MQRLLLAVMCALLSVACSESPSENQYVRFTGICDGSAAVQIGHDKLLVAYDEKNALYLYGSQGGAPLTEFSYGELLGITAKEVDVEAAAVVSDGIWWIGSHGLDGDGEVAPNRRLLFKINTPVESDQRLQLLQPAIDLYPIITDSPSGKTIFSKKVLRKKPKKGGLNIEGMVAESDNSLLLGLRSPLSKEGNALIIRLEKKAGQFDVDRVFQLDLGKRGIRDIQKTDNGYLLIAGDVGRGGVSALYLWRPDSKAKVLTHLDRSLNPEALVKYSDYWLVMSDDGKVARRGEDTCDEVADESSADRQVYFRAIKITEHSLAGE